MDKSQAHWTLIKNGFAHDPSESRYDVYRGTLNVHGDLIPIIIEIRDWYFTKPPLIFLDKEAAELSNVLPHILAYGGICYLGGARSPTFNMYDPGGTILLCLDEAKKTLEDVYAGKSLNDIVDEFYAYWNSGGRLNTVYYDLKTDTDGIVPYREIAPATDTFFGISTNQTEYLNLFDEIQKAHNPLEPILKRNAAIININAQATVLPNNWPPETLEDALEWVDSLDPGISAKVLHYLGRAGQGKFSGKSKRSIAVNPVFLLSFLNGIFGFIVMVPKAYKISKDMTRSVDSYARILKKQAKILNITRFTGQTMSSSFVTERNINGEKTLSNMSIALIGCGNIGSHLVKFLVQAGSGSGENGKLLLVDNDRLTPGNIGRHLLGFPFLHMNKAEACADYLKQNFPTINISSYPKSVIEMLAGLSRFDLVIDATGEEGLSIALNHHILSIKDKRPAALFVWLEGNGVSARSLLNRKKGDACYNCLRPDLGRPERFPAMKKGSKIKTVEATSCGDEDYTPYAVSSSAVAAALGLQMALDYVNDRSEKLFRQRVISDDAQITKDQNVKPSPDCPTCMNQNSPG